MQLSILMCSLPIRREKKRKEKKRKEKRKSYAEITSVRLLSLCHPKISN
jgi:hypothetical protein